MIAIIINKDIQYNSKEDKTTKWIDPSEIKKERKISKGAFAKVYLGNYGNQTGKK